MYNLLLEAGAVEGGAAGMLGTLAMPLVVIVILYFLMLRPQRKREKAVQEMRSKLQVGDEIVTIGGIVGRVVSIHDDTLVMETSSACSKIRILRSAIQSNNTVHDAEPEKK